MVPPLQVMPLPCEVDLEAFFEQHSRLPVLGDDPAPWTYRGWLLPYVIQLHAIIPAVADRWGYHLRTLKAGRLLNEPIPQVTFGEADEKVFSQLRVWSRLVGRDGGGWSDFRVLLNWLSWGLSVSKEQPALSDAVNETLYCQINLAPLLERPHDYFGEHVCRSRGNGWNPTAFFPTPHAVVECMVRMTMSDEQKEKGDLRTKSVCDACVGSGRMLLHASNYSLRLCGQDIDPLAVSMCVLNGVLYAPWLAFPFPESVVGPCEDATPS